MPEISLSGDYSRVPKVKLHNQLDVATSIVMYEKYREKINRMISRIS